MENFVKALDKERDAFQYLKQIPSKLSVAKLKEGIFVGPQIKKILREEKFYQKLSVVELTSWRFFKRIVSEFLGNKKVKNYEKLERTT